MSPLLVSATVSALTPYPPPEIVPLLFSVPMAPVLLMPSLFVEVMRPLLDSVPMAPLLLMPAPPVDTILALASLVSSVIAPALTAACEPPVISPRSLLSRRAIVFVP